MQVILNFLLYILVINLVQEAAGGLIRQKPINDVYNSSNSDCPESCECKLWTPNKMKRAIDDLVTTSNEKPWYSNFLYDPKNPFKLVEEIKELTHYLNQFELKLNITCKKKQDKIVLPVKIENIDRVTVLTLQNIGLQSIPENVCFYKHLRQINLDHNRFSDSSKIKHLSCEGKSQLSQIDLSYNELTKLDGSLGKFNADVFSFVAENNKIANT